MKEKEIPFFTTKKGVLINDSTNDTLRSIKKGTVPMIISELPNRLLDWERGDETLARITNTLKEDGILCIAMDNTADSLIMGAYFTEVLEMFLIDTIVVRRRDKAGISHQHQQGFTMVYVFSKSASIEPNFIMDKSSKPILSMDGVGVEETKEKRNNIWDGTMSSNVLPVSIARDLVRTYSKDGDVILNLYAGASMPVVSACEELGVSWYAVEESTARCEQWLTKRGYSK